MNASPTTDTPPHHTAPIALWRVAEAFMHVLFNLFGAPEDVAARHTLAAPTHKLIASWLACAEAMLRRLLLIEASALPKPPPPPPRPRRAHERKPASPAKAARASFRCFPNANRLSAGVGQSAAGQREARAQYKLPPYLRRVGQRLVVIPIDPLNPAHFPRREPPRFRAARPLAGRYEAILRVFNNPAPYAARLARRLHATPHRVGELLRAPPEAAERIDNFGGFTEAAETARAGALNSS